MSMIMKDSSANAILLLLIALRSVSSQQYVGNNNLVLSDGGNILTSVSVMVEIDETMISIENGIGLQLNTYSPNDSALSFQQFFYTMEPPFTTLQMQVETFDGSGNEIMNSIYDLIDLDESATIPTGWVLAIELINANDGTITSAVFTITDPSNSSNPSVAQGTANMLNPSAIPGDPESAANLAPIVALTFNIVSYGDFTTANFAAGSGNIIYSSENSLTADSEPPPETWRNGHYSATGEQSNMFYGSSISSNNGAYYTQPFGLAVLSISFIVIYGYPAMTTD
jgi:hypothetical protein